MPYRRALRLQATSTCYSAEAANSPGNDSRFPIHSILEGEHEYRLESPRQIARARRRDTRIRGHDATREQIPLLFPAASSHSHETTTYAPTAAAAVAQCCDVTDINLSSSIATTQRRAVRDVRNSNLAMRRPPLERETTLIRRRAGDKEYSTTIVREGIGASSIAVICYSVSVKGGSAQLIDRVIFNWAFGSGEGDYLHTLEAGDAKIA